MKADNPFDKKLDVWGARAPESIRDASIYVTDTLDVAWAAVQAVFEDQAKPEHAIRILELFFAEEKSSDFRHSHQNIRRKHSDNEESQK